MYQCEHCCKHFSRNDSLTRHSAASYPASKSLKGGSFVEMSCVKNAGDRYPSCQEFVEFNRSGIKPRTIDTLVNGSSVKTIHRKLLAGKSPSIVNNIYLPSDIPSLKKKLQLLVGEYVAGNTTTRSQILAILDNLKERGEIALMEYALIKNFARGKVPDVADEEFPDEDDGSSAENLNADSSVENPTLNVDDVSEYLIPVDGYQNGVCDMEHMIKVTAKDIIRSKCKHIAQLVNELKNQLAHDRKYDERVKEIENLSQVFCTGNPAVYNELQQALQSVEYNSPVKKSTLAELRMLINSVDDQLFRIRQIFVRCTNTTLEDLPSTLATLLNDNLIDIAMYTKLASMTSITYPELRTLLVKSEPDAIMEDSMDEENLLQSPDIQLLWNSLK